MAGTAGQLRAGVKAVLGPPLSRLGVAVVRAAAADELAAYRRAARHPVDVFALALNGLARERADLTVVQIGANDGERDDSLAAHLRHHDLRGLLVEPLPQPFARLADRYCGHPRVAVANCAVAPRTGTLTLYTFADRVEGPHQLDVFTSTDRRLVEAAKRDRGLKSAVVRVDVPAVTFADLMARHGLATVDVLVIDTEGYDLEILRSIDLAAHRPALIQVEYINLHPADRCRLIDLLVGAGYRVAFAGAEVVAQRAE